MAFSGNLALQPWIQELLLNSNGCWSDRPLPGQLLEVIQDAEGAKKWPGSEDVVRVSDGVSCVCCLITGEATSSTSWEEKQFGFRRAVGQLIVLQEYTVSLREGPRLEDWEFYLTVHSFSLLPLEQPRQVLTDWRWSSGICDSKEDPTIRKRLDELWQKQLQERNLPSSGTALSQLLEEMHEGQREVLTQLAQDCLDLQEPEGAPEKVLSTQWAVARRNAKGEAVFTVPALRLCTDEEEEAALGFLGADHAPGSPQDLECHFLLPSPDRTSSHPWTLHPCLSLTLTTSSSSCSSSSTSSCSCAASSSSDEALLLAAIAEASRASQDSRRSDIVASPKQTSSSFRPVPSMGRAQSARDPVVLSAGYARGRSPVLPAWGQVSRGQIATGGRAQGVGPPGTKRPGGLMPMLEFVGHRNVKRVWDTAPDGPETAAPPPENLPQGSPARAPPQHHKDGSSFQYHYPVPSTQLCTEVRATRITKELLAWACQVLTEQEPAEA